MGEGGKRKNRCPGPEGLEQRSLRTQSLEEIERKINKLLAC